MNFHFPSSDCSVFGVCVCAQLLFRMGKILKNAFTSHHHGLVSSLEQYYARGNVHSSTPNAKLWQRSLTDWQRSMDVMGMNAFFVYNELVIKAKRRTHRNLCSEFHTPNSYFYFSFFLVKWEGAQSTQRAYEREWRFAQAILLSIKVA